MNKTKTSKCYSAIECIDYVCRYHGIIIPEPLDLPSNISPNIIKSLIAILVRLGFEIHYRKVDFKKFRAKEFVFPLIIELNQTCYIIAENESQEVMNINEGLVQNDLLSLLRENSGKVNSISVSLKLNTGKLLSEVLSEIENNVKLLIDKYYPNCYAAGITGSYANGTNNSQSDIDIILISELVSEICSETYYFKNSIFDIFTYPKNHLDKFINMDIYHRKGIILDKFRKTVVIQDTDNYLENIRAKTSFLYDNGPLPTSHKIFSELKSKILSDISDLKGDLSREKNLMILAKSISTIVNFHSILNNSWFPNGKHIPTFFERNHPDFNSKLFNSLEEFYVNNKLDGFIHLMEDLVSFSTKSFQKKSNSYALNEDDDDNTLIIGFGGVIDPVYFSSNILNPIFTEIEENNYFYYRNNNFNYSNINYFLKIYDLNNAKKSICNRLIEIRKKLKNKMPQLQIIFPFNLLDSHLNYTQTPAFSNSYFKSLSFFFTNHLKHFNKWPTEFGLSLANQFNTELISQNRLKKELVLNFYSVLLEDWLACLFEYKNNNYLQIADLIKDQLNEFEKKYSFEKSIKSDLANQVNSIKGMDKLVINFSLLGKNEIIKAHNFYLFKQLNSKRINNQEDLINFFIYKSTIEYFCDLVSLTRSAKCYFIFACIKNLER